MTIFKLQPDYFETLTLETNPIRKFVSSSAGITGGVRVFAERSTIEKETAKFAAFNDRKYDDDSVDEFRNNLASALRTKMLEGNPYTNFGFAMEMYLDKVNSSPMSLRTRKQMEIIRFTPSVRFTSDTLRKNVVRKIFFPHYQVKYPTCQWAYTNYHSLNFFTSSQVPTGSCMIYPAASSSVLDGSVNSSKFYLPSTSFTFDFYVNPRYTTDAGTQEYQAGTVFHMSSSYAVSIVSGTLKDGSGNPSAFRVMLQLSHSAEVPPSLISLTGTNNERPIGDNYVDVGSGKGDLIFLSTDDILKLNTWHHVGIRWGANNQAGTGSIVIDGVEDTTFIIPSATCMQGTFNDPIGDPDALFLGNFWNSPNDSEKGSLISTFFNYTAQLEEGVIDLFGGEPTITDPPVNENTFSHPLNAEIHELKIYDTYKSLQQLLTSSASGSAVIPTDMMFYVPPFFVKESRQRAVMQTPFQTIQSTTDDPFNVALSFGVGGHLINLENFVREFVQKQYPRLYNLTASALTHQTDTAELANTFLFATGSIRKRNLTVLPCDNGKLIPGFKLLGSGTYFSTPSSGSLMDKYTNNFGVLDFSLISLIDLVPTASIQPGLFQYSILSASVTEAVNVSSASISAGRGFVNSRLLETTEQAEGTGANTELVSYPATTADGEYSLTNMQEFPDTIGTGSIAAGIMGPSPENPGVASGSILTILQRTRDNTSDEVVFFDASNLFYGGQIMKESFSVVDNSVTGSGGKVKITFKDDGRGNLYRADAESVHAKWNSVGNLLYEEGIAVIKTPNVPFFGKDQFEINLRGVQNLHILEINVPCQKGHVNSSSNPVYKSLKPSNYASNTNADFVYITGLNFHDENLNIIARTNLTQPVVKRDEDGYKFRVKLDF